MAGESRQYEGRSAAEAAIRACEDLGVTRSSLRYEVVSETGVGLDRRVVIKVEPPAAGESRPADGPDSQEEPPVRATYDRDARGGRDGRDSRGGESRDRDARGAGPRGGGRDRRDGGRGDGPGRGGPRDSGRGARPPSRGFGDRERDDEGQDGVDAMLKLDAVPQQAAPERPELTTALSPRAAKAKEVVGDLVRLMGFGLTVRVVEDGVEEIHVHMIGADEPRVIGKTGDVLLSLQFIVNRIVSRDTDGDQVVVLDAAGYRQRRRQALEELARRLAARAVEEGKAIRLSPMSAHDRRVFHVTLKDYDGVSTRSEGEGLFRKMLIIPAPQGRPAQTTN